MCHEVGRTDPQIFDRTWPRWRSNWVRSDQRIRRNSLLVRTLARPRWVCFAPSRRPLAELPDPRPEAGSRGPARALMRMMTGPRRRAEARAVPRTGTGGQPLWRFGASLGLPGALWWSPGGSSVPPGSARACGSSGPDSGARAPPRPSRRTTPGGAGRPGCPVPPSCRASSGRAGGTVPRRSPGTPRSPRRGRRAGGASRRRRDPRRGMILGVVLAPHQQDLPAGAVLDHRVDLRQQTEPPVERGGDLDLILAEAQQPERAPHPSQSQPRTGAGPSRRRPSPAAGPTRRAAGGSRRPWPRACVPGPRAIRRPGLTPTARQVGEGTDIFVVPFDGPLDVRIRVVRSAHDSLAKGVSAHKIPQEPMVVIRGNGVPRPRRCDHRTIVGRTA